MPDSIKSVQIPTENQRPVEIPWEEAQALLAKSARAANGNPGPTEIKIQRPVQITMEEALAMVARQPQPRAPLFVKSTAMTASIDPLDRRK